MNKEIDYIDKKIVNLMLFDADIVYFFVHFIFHINCLDELIYKYYQFFSILFRKS
jgi:hypothetical protein